MAAVTEQPIRYAYPTFGETRGEEEVDILRQCINAFGLLLEGVPSIDDSDSGGSRQSFTEEALRSARNAHESFNTTLCEQIFHLSPPLVTSE